MGSHLSLWRSAPNLRISCSLAVLLETIETAAPPVAWPSLTWVSQSRWLAGWHNTVLVPYAYYLSSLPDPTYAGTRTCSHTAWPAGLSHTHTHTHTRTVKWHTHSAVDLFKHSNICNVHIRECRWGSTERGAVWVISEVAQNICYEN